MFCLPGYVVAFDPETQLAQIQCSIQKVLLDTNTGVTIPIIENVPVHFPGNDEFYLWHEIKPDCEGLVLFSQRALDEWINSGSVKKPHDLRMFSEKDAIFIPGVRSKPGAITGFKNEGIGLSNYDGDSFIHVKESGIDIQTATLNITAQTNITGATDIQGNFSTDGTFTNNGKDVGSTHKHDGSPTAAIGPKSPTGEPL